MRMMTGMRSPYSGIWERYVGRRIPWQRFVTMLDARAKRVGIDCCDVEGTAPMTYFGHT